MKTKKLSKKIRLKSKTLIITVMFLLFSSLPNNALKKEEKKVAGTVPVAVTTMVGETETMLPETTEILHGQLDGGTGGVTSQDFESNYTSEAADDFEVPTGQNWTIETVTVYGSLSQAGAVLNEVRVRFYNDAGGLPATSSIYDRLVSVYTTGSFIITLPQTLPLTPGRYWVSMQAILDYGTQGQWFWNQRTVQYPDSNPSAWRNPGGGFGTPCTDWGSRVSGCGVGYSPDLIFALGGTLKTAARADLKPTPITYNSSDLIEGRTVEFDSGVSNLGSTDSGIFNVRWLVDGEDVGAYGSHKSVPGNSTIMDDNSKFYWNATAGQHTITFLVDVDNHVEESDEDNNKTEITVELKPDLTPVPISHFPTEIYIGDKVFFDSGIKNIGNVASGIFNIRWLVDGKDVKAYGMHESIPANSTIMNGNSHFEWTAKDGTHTITFLVDVDNYIAELNENNNNTQVTVVVQKKEDLPGGKPDFEPECYPPINPVANEEVLFYVRAKNNTHASPGKDFLVNLKRLGNTDIELIGEKTTNVDRWLVFEWKAVAGNHNILVTVDVNNDIKESNEYNNSITLSLQVDPPLGCGKVGVEANWVIRDNGENLYDGLYHTVAQTGTQWLRINFRLGPWCFPNDETPHGPNSKTWFQTYDEVISGFLEDEETNIKIYGLIGSEAVKQNIGTEPNPEPNCNCQDCHQYNWPSDGTEEEKRQWITVYVRNFVAIVEHFKNRVKVFESFNEPYMHGVTAEWFAVMLDEIWAKRNEYNWDEDGVKIISGPIFGADNEEGCPYCDPHYFLEETFDYGESNFLWDKFPADGFGIHLYFAQDSIDELEIINKMEFPLYMFWKSIERIEGKNTTKRIYVSEFGWDKNIVDLQGQADNLRTGFEFLRTNLYVEIAIWFSFRDILVGGNRYNLGLINAVDPAQLDSSIIRPSFCAFQEQTCQGRDDELCDSISLNNQINNRSNNIRQRDRKNKGKIRNER